MVRVAVCSSLLGDTPERQQKYAAEMHDNIQSHIKYATQHKYDYICPTTLEQVSPMALQEPHRKPSWYKILLVRRLSETYDYVLWLDADAHVKNYDMSVETIVKTFMSRQHIACIGISNLEVSHIQAGAFIIRKSLDTTRWLDTIWSQKQFLDHFWWEQAAIIHLYQTQLEFSSRLALIPSAWPIIQCFPTHNENPNSLVIHYAGKLRGYMPTPGSSESNNDHHTTPAD